MADAHPILSQFHAANFQLVGSEANSQRHLRHSSTTVERKRAGRVAARIQSGFAFCLPGCDYDTPRGQLLILQSAVVLGEPPLAPQSAIFALPGKSRLFSAFHRHLAAPHLRGDPGEARDRTWEFASVTRGLGDGLLVARSDGFQIYRGHGRRYCLLARECREVSAVTVSLAGTMPWKDSACYVSLSSPIRSRQS
jgi:hypothetical protein